MRASKSLIQAIVAGSIAAIVLSACSSSGTSSAPSARGSVGRAAIGGRFGGRSIERGVGPRVGRTIGAASPIAGGLLDKVLKARHPPGRDRQGLHAQSYLKPDGTWTGFDIEVGQRDRQATWRDSRIRGPRLGRHHRRANGPNRFDISVGSMTITKPREKLFTSPSPYYYTPAQMAATTKSGITTLDGLAGKTICVGVATTYQDWLQGNTAERIGSARCATPPPAQGQDPADRCQLRRVHQGRPRRRRGLPDLGDRGRQLDRRMARRSSRSASPSSSSSSPPATDKSGRDADRLHRRRTKIIDDMHADGTLTALSQEVVRRPGPDRQARQPDADRVTRSSTGADAGAPEIWRPCLIRGRNCDERRRPRGRRSPPFVAQMEAADRRRTTRFRIRFVLTWAVILGAVVTFFALTVGIHYDFHEPVAAVHRRWHLGDAGHLDRCDRDRPRSWPPSGRSAACRPIPVFNGIASLYVSFVRGTPLIVQILFIYLALPAAGIVLPEIPTGILALGFNYGAYLTEVFRAGIQAVPYGQVEAARSLGLPRSARAPPGDPAAGSPDRRSRRSAMTSSR